jgi:dihydrofolate reductase
MNRKLIVYIAMSIDGYIARKDGDISWLSIVEMPDEDYGYAEFISTIDTVILGRKTYHKVLTLVDEFPHKDKECFCFTRTEQPSIGNTHFYTGDIPSLVLQLKKQKGKNIFCDGGSEIVNLLLQENLVDELILSIIPICLGEGISLFKDGRTETKLSLVNSRTFSSGLVQLHYML